MTSDLELLNFVPRLHFRLSPFEKGGLKGDLG
jgi:hypothetical protein